MKSTVSNRSEDFFNQRQERFAKIAKIVPHENKLNDDVFLDHCASKETIRNIQRLTSDYISVCFNEGNTNLTQSEVLDKLDNSSKTLHNKTPNGVLLCKHETTLEFNLLHKSVSRLFYDLGFLDLTEFWQMPLNVRIVDGKVINREQRSYDSSKPHSDTWVGEPSDMILVNIPILGDIENTTLQWFSPPKDIGESHLKILNDYDEGLEIGKHFSKIDVNPTLGHLYFSDPTTLHQTIKRGGKTRVSIDIRFRMKVSPEYRKVVLDNCNQKFLKYYVSTNEFLKVGDTKLVYISETLEECQSKYSNNATGSHSVAENNQIYLNSSSLENTQLKCSDFLRMFGLESIHGFPNACLKEIEKYNFSYQRLTVKENNQVILNTLKILEDNPHSVVGSHRKDIWEKGWSENAQDFVEGNYNIEKLKPKYFKQSPYIRLDGEFIKPIDNEFEINVFTVLRHWVYRQFFNDVEEIYEFGCGTGLNLALLAKIFPSKKLHGLDWAAASQKILKNLAMKFGWNLTGYNFDLFNPDYNFHLARNSAIMTSTALEQLGENYEAFIEFILDKSPKICVHVEPVLELYDENDLLDSLAIQYHKKRGYLEGFLPKLRELEKKKQVEIIFVHRMKLGNHLHDGYSMIAWRPMCIK